MTLTVKHYDTTVTVEEPRDDLNIDELVARFRLLALAMGYHPASVASGFNDPEEGEQVSS